MFRKLIKNKKAQNTAEYAILISLVVAGIIAMQTFAQRALQARIRDAAVYMVNQSSNVAEGLGATLQYEPYYTKTDYQVSRTDLDQQKIDENTKFNVQTLDTSDRVRIGRAITAYNGAINADSDTFVTPSTTVHYDDTLDDSGLVTPQTQ